ncbi:MAG: hypothetical protein PVI46_10915, partial [Lysobacterales bacterium]
MIMNVTGSPVARKAAFFAMFLSLMPALDGNASEEPFRSASGVEDTRAHIARLPKTDIWWTRNGKDMAWNNRHLRAIFPAVPVYRASQVSELAYRLNPEIPTFTVSTPDGDMPFKAFLDSDQSTTMGIVILHRGDIVFEHYPRQQPYETPI